MKQLLVGLIGISGPHREIILRSMLDNKKCVEFRPFCIKIKEHIIYLGIVSDNKIWGGGLISKCEKIFESSIIIRDALTLADLKLAIQKTIENLFSEMLRSIETFCRTSIDTKVMQAIRHYAEFYVTSRVQKVLFRFFSGDNKQEINFEMYGWVFERIEKFDLPIPIDFTPQSLIYLNDTYSKIKRNYKLLEKIISHSTILKRLMK